MRAAISLLVLLLSMCGVQTESHGTDASTQDVSTGLKELRDMMVDLRAMKRRLAVSESKVEVLERVLQDTKAEMKTEADNLKKQNAAQEAELAVLKKDSAAHEQELAALKTRLATRETVMIDNLKNENAAQKTELTAAKTRLAATETELKNLEKEIKAAPKVAFSAGLGHGYRESKNDVNVVFKTVITNLGQAYSSTTGFFTAPVRGVYYFRFTVMDFQSSRSMRIRMNKNGQQLMHLFEYDPIIHPYYLSSGLTLQLEKGDAVNLVLPAGRRLNGNINNDSTFSGFLLFPL